MSLRRPALVLAMTLLPHALALAAAPTAVLPVWPGNPPDDTRTLAGAERDTSGPNGRMVAGKPVIRLGDVAKPELHVFLPPPEKRTGAAVVICPGGGYNILAWDLEGTEVAEWLNSIGVAGVVLKYRVPSGGHKLPVQDAQRAIRLTRAHAAEWGLKPDRVGVLGFSAGGDTAARAALNHATNHYAAVDAADQQPARPDFAVLVYPAYLINSEGAVKADLTVEKTTPPALLVHAWDDGIPCANSLQLALAMRKAGAPAELHLYDRGGHGYGLRPTEDPVTRWPARAEDWFRRNGWIP